MNEYTKPDRRSAKTEKCIWDAFAALILEQELSALKVSDIVKAADISRGTFYLHYKDKYDLLARMTDTLLAELRELPPQARRAAQDTGNPEIDHIFALLLEYIEPRALWFRALLSLSGEGAFSRRLREMMADDLRSGTYLTMSHAYLTVPLDYWVSYTLSANMGVIQTWLDGGCRETAAEIARVLAEITKRGVYQTASR